MAQQRRRSSSNPNQRRTTRSRRRTPATRSTSTVNTNTFSKGMNKDIAPSLEPSQYWWHARNLANNSEDGDLGIVGNEPSNLLSVTLPYTVIGAIHRYGDEWIIYTTETIQTSQFHSVRQSSTSGMFLIVESSPIAWEPCSPDTSRSSPAQRF